MMRLIKGAAKVLILLLVPLSGIGRADYLEVRRSAKVKSQPVVDASTMRSVQPPLLLPLVAEDQTNGYYQVELDDGQRGWIYRSLVRRFPGDMPSDEVDVTVDFPISDFNMDSYYSTVDTNSPARLRQTLHDVIDDHVRFPYTSTATDTWDILELADEDPNDSDRVLDLYRNESYLKVGGGNNNYQREHSWPKSYGFKVDGAANSAFTDCHHLFICNGSYNSSRSNKPYDVVSMQEGTEKPTLENNSVGGNGQSNWTIGKQHNGSWQVWPERRGDVARALFYLDVRYEGDTHSETNHQEIDLILTNDRNQMIPSSTNQNVGRMGVLSVLMQWHNEDPVDDNERARNDTVYQFQGNRNPFIDHPEWVDIVFN